MSSTEWLRLTKDIQILWTCPFIFHSPFFPSDQLDALFPYIYLFHLSTSFEHHNARHKEIELC